MNEGLLRELAPATIALLRRRGVDFAAAEDAVQEALIEAIGSWQTDPPRDPQGWLVTVAWRKFPDETRPRWPTGTGAGDRHVAVETGRATDLPVGDRP